MRLPDLVAYQTAIQHPATAFADPDLRTGAVTTGRFGLPRAVAGNFAVTYQVARGSQRWAVRCFHRDAADRAQRYAAISQTLHQLRHAALVDAAYLPVGVRVGQTWFPITKMPWLDGLTLNRAIEQRLHQPAALLDLERRFTRLVDELGTNGLAHGDLQHGNVLVDTTGELRLVDYDGMFVPALRGLRAAESGDPNYQHPDRTDQFNADLDRFSVLVIVLALRALAADPSLWSTYNSDDNLLFRRLDFLQPSQSALFARLLASPATRDLAHTLVQACARPLGDVPPLAPPQAPAPAPITIIKPLHAAILNRLYGSPAKPKPRPKTPSRTWKVRRTGVQTALAFSADGTALITTDAIGTLRTRDTVGGRTRSTVRGSRAVRAVAIGRKLVVVTSDGCVANAASAEKLFALPVSKLDGPVALAPNAAYVAVGTGNGGVRCWNVGNGKLIGASRQRGSVTALAVSPDGRRVASASAGLGVHLWALPGGRALHTLVTQAPIAALAFSHDGRALAAATRDGMVVVWDVASSTVLREIETHITVMALALAPDAQSVALSGADGSIALRDVYGRRAAPSEPTPWWRTLLQRWA